MLRNMEQVFKYNRNRLIIDESLRTSRRVKRGAKINKRSPERNGRKKTRKITTNRRLGDKDRESKEEEEEEGAKRKRERLELWG